MTKLRKYSVLIEETLARNVIVEARDEEHADEIVQKAYDEEKIVLTADDNNGDLVLGGEYTTLLEDDNDEPLTDISNNQ